MKRKKSLIAFMVALAISVLHPGLLDDLPSGSFNAKVLSVADGDTLTVRKSGRKVKVRLYGIDCPESRQSFGKEATDYVRNKVLGKKVRIYQKNKDRYGRIVGIVEMENRENLNRRLVSEGLAWWYKDYAPDDLGLAVRELNARVRGRGLWMEHSPVPPWTYRKSSRRIGESGPPNL